METFPASERGHAKLSSSVESEALRGQAGVCAQGEVQPCVMDKECPVIAVSKSTSSPLMNGFHPALLIFQTVF